VSFYRAEQELEKVGVTSPAPRSARTIMSNYSVHLAFARPPFQPSGRFRVQSNSTKAVSVYILSVAVWN